MLPTPLMAFIRDNNEAILAALLFVTVLLFLGFLLVLLRLSRLNRLYARLTRGTSGGNIEEVLTGYMSTVSDTVHRMEALERNVERLAENQRLCLQRVGIVRFDAFEEVGGEQSFAVALLDQQCNGIALSSVYSRTDMRVYAKALRRGQPSHPLTREEEQAVALAEGK